MNSKQRRQKLRRERVRANDIIQVCGWLLDDIENGQTLTQSRTQLLELKQFVNGAPPKEESE